ncbi:MAG TPA: very short patch repair endonuclease [Streptosporangiaceae bacterium]
MADHLSPAGRSRNMAAIRSKNTRPERLLRAELRRRDAIGYRLHPSLPGRPDIVFTRWKVAVFVDGAFWHGHPDHFNAAAATAYWRDKIARTQARDAQASRQLQAEGWRVLRFWDFEVLADVNAVAEQVIQALMNAGRRTPNVC